jgi:predicted nuclease of predicted toxin-antitoxin system
MRFVADAGVEGRIVRELRNEHGRESIYWMKEEALKQKADLQLEKEPSIPDSVVRQRAVENEAMLITQDKEFARTMEIEKSCPRQGVVLISLAGNGNEKADKVMPFFRERQDQMQGCKTYIGEDKQVIGKMEHDNVFPPTRAEQRNNSQTQAQSLQDRNR